MIDTRSTTTLETMILDRTSKLVVPASDGDDLSLAKVLRPLLHLRVSDVKISVQLLIHGLQNLASTHRQRNRLLTASQTSTPTVAPADPLRSHVVQPNLAVI